MSNSTSCLDPGAVVGSRSLQVAAVCCLFYPSVAFFRLLPRLGFSQDPSTSAFLQPPHEALWQSSAACCLNGLEPHRFGKYHGPCISVASMKRLCKVRPDESCARKPPGCHNIPASVLANLMAGCGGSWYHSDRLFMLIVTLFFICSS